MSRAKWTEFWTNYNQFLLIFGYVIVEPPLKNPRRETRLKNSEETASEVITVIQSDIKAHLLPLSE